MIPYARNARTHSEAQVAQIAGSIREFGFTNPVLIDPKSGIIAGHGRVLASPNGLQTGVADRNARRFEAPKGRKPSWGGFLPQYLGRDLCQRMREILVTDFEPIYGDADASSALAELRDDLGEMLRESQTALRVTADEAQLWTFAGGRINGTLRTLFQGIWNIKSTATGAGGAL